MDAVGPRFAFDLFSAEGGGNFCPMIDKGEGCTKHAVEPPFFAKFVFYFDGVIRPALK